MPEVSLEEIEVEVGVSDVPEVGMAPRLMRLSDTRFLEFRGSR